VVDERAHKPRGGAFLGDAVDRQPCFARVDSGAGADTHDNRVVGQGCELLRKLPRDAARTDNDRADAAGRDVGRNRCPGSDPDRAIGRHRTHLKPTRGQAAHESWLGDRALWNQDRTLLGGARPLRNKTPRRMITGNEVNRIPGGVQCLRRAVADGSYPVVGGTRTPWRASTSTVVALVTTSQPYEPA